MVIRYDNVAYGYVVTCYMGKEDGNSSGQDVADCMNIVLYEQQIV